MALTVFVAATVVIESLVIVFLFRGLRATSRPAGMRCVGHCAALAFGEIVAVGAGKAATLVASFGGVAHADPQMKAMELSRSIDAGMTIVSLGEPAVALPVVVAVLLFLRARRYPRPSAEAAQRQQVRR